MLRFVAIFIAVFFFTLHFAATLYINSSFLAHFFPLKMIGVWYVLGALGNILLFWKAPALLNRLGMRKFLFVFLFLTLGATLGAAYAFSPIDAAIFFIIYASAAPMIYYGLDLMLEELTSNRKTGEVRGLYLTLLNIAIVTGPLFITILGTDGKFRYFYLAAAIILVPLWIFIYLFLWPKHKLEKYDNHSLPVRLWFRRRAVRRVTLTRFVLEFFYAFMAIYMPIYLHSVIGFSWTQIGIIFSIMLVPFILFEWPAGELADRKYGEKEIMSLGFVITFLSLIFMPFLGPSVVWWTGVLFLSRIGAAFVEITTETYFFKHVDSTDNGLLSIFRLSRPMGLILGALVGSFALYYFSFTAAFVALTIVIVFGWRESLKLKDTL